MPFSPLRQVRSIDRIPEYGISCTFGGFWNTYPIRRIFYFKHRYLGLQCNYKCQANNFQSRRVFSIRYSDSWGDYGQLNNPCARDTITYKEILLTV